MGTRGAEPGRNTFGARPFSAIGQRHRKRARFVEGQHNLALLAVLVLEGEAYRASVARDSAITFMHLPLPPIAVTRRLAKSPQLPRVHSVLLSIALRSMSAPT